MRGDRAALAVANEPDTRAVDLGNRRQEVHTRLGVFREHLDRRVEEHAPRTTFASIISAKTGDPTTRQRVGDHEEGLVTEECLIPILRAGPRDEHDRGMRPLTLRDGQRRRELRAIDVVRESNLALLVRERPDGRLRPLRAKVRDRVEFNARKSQRHLHAALVQHAPE